MTAEQQKDDNLVQLKSAEKANETVAMRNQINSLEKSLHDVRSDLAKSTSGLKSELKSLSSQDNSIEVNIKATLDKITSVEQEIAKLHEEIDETNVGMVKSVQTLESDQQDLSTKVSETYKQLGSIEKSYTTLKSKSTKVTNEIKQITVSVEAIADEIRQKILTVEENSNELDQKINTLESQSSEQAKQLSEGQEELIERTNQIVKEAKKTSKALAKSIDDSASTMKKIESELLAELENLAKSTDDKTAELKNGLDKADTEIQSHSAKMLLLQSVDEALEKRAEKLEQTAQTLTSETEQLSSASEKLAQRSTELEDSVEVLDVQLAKLQQDSEEQQAQIDVLRQKTTDTNTALFALAKLENKHFKVAASLVTVAIAAVIGLYFLQDYQWSNSKIEAAQQEQIVNQKISGVHQQISGLQQHVVTTDEHAAQRISQLENQVSDLNEQLKTVNDKNTSLDNRLVNIAPLRTIGSDNVIHSDQWIAKQSSNHLAIKVGSASSEKDLYDLAVRYNHYLTDVLSFKQITANSSQSYELYMGNYADQAAAEAALGDLPFRLNGKKPELVNYSDIQ